MTRYSTARALAAVVTASGILGAAGMAAAADNASVTVNYEVQAINSIAIAGSAPTLTISAATAGSAPTAVEDSSLTYAVTTNQSNRDRKSTRLNCSHVSESRMPSSA